MIRAALVAGVLVGITHAARSFHPGDGAVFGSGSLLAAGFLLLAALQLGKVFEGLRLPHLTGYLLCGLAFGPQGLNLVNPAMLLDLALIKKVAVGLIALLAGCELDLTALAPRLRAIGLTAALSLLGAFTLLFGVLLGVTYLLPATSWMTPTERAMVALVCANALCAFSPPVVIGILSELKAKGPLSELWVSVVVLADLAIVLSFSLTSALAHEVFPGEDHGNAIVALALHIFGSLGVGAVVGAVLALYASRVREALGLFVFAALFVVAEAGNPLHLDPLLVGLSAGLLLENVSRAGGHEVARAAGAAALPTFALFFAVIGAEVHLDLFLQVAPYALALAFTRAVGITGGARRAARAVGLSEDHQRRLPYGMLPQAGIAIALATSVKSSFAGWGEPVGALLLGTVVVNELMGPIAFRHVAARSGEAGLRGEVVDLPVATVEWSDDNEPSDLRPVDFPR
jgi:Kef-type K+ transport system membrane component KefB